MTVQPLVGFKSFIGFGRRLGLNAYGVLTSRMSGSDVPLGNKIADATIVVGAESTDVRNITITLKDANGNAIDEAGYVEIVMLLNAAGTDFVVTGGSTGIAIGASGKLQQIIAKKLWRAISTTAGVIALTWTDTGTEVAFLGVRLPNGRMVVSSALTNT